MTETRQGYLDGRFALGMLAGTGLGLGLALWLAPRAAAEVAEQAAASVGRVTNRGLQMKDEVAEAVARGAHEIERVATSVVHARPGARL